MQERWDLVVSRDQALSFERNLKNWQNLDSKTESLVQTDCTHKTHQALSFIMQISIKVARFASSWGEVLGGDPSSKKQGGNKCQNYGFCSHWVVDGKGSNMLHVVPYVHTSNRQGIPQPQLSLGMAQLFRAIIIMTLVGIVNVFNRRATGGCGILQRRISTRMRMMRRWHTRRVAQNLHMCGDSILLFSVGWLRHQWW